MKPLKYCPHCGKELIEVVTEANDEREYLCEGCDTVIIQSKHIIVKSTSLGLYNTWIDT